MIIDDTVKTAVLHEAGHSVAYYLLGHKNAGIATRKEGLVFCNLVAPNSPEMGTAAGSAAEVLFLEKYDKSGARQDRIVLGVSESEYEELVTRTVQFLSPHRRKIRRIFSLLLKIVRPRESLDDFPDAVGPVGGMQLPQDGHTYSIIITADEISEAMVKK